MLHWVGRVPIAYRLMLIFPGCHVSILSFNSDTQTERGDVLHFPDVSYYADYGHYHIRTFENSLINRNYHINVITSILMAFPSEHTYKYQWVKVLRYRYILNERKWVRRYFMSPLQSALLWGATKCILSIYRNDESVVCNTNESVQCQMFGNLSNFQIK